MSPSALLSYSKFFAGIAAQTAKRCQTFGAAICLVCVCVCLCVPMDEHGSVHLTAFTWICDQNPYTVKCIYAMACVCVCKSGEHSFGRMSAYCVCRVSLESHQFYDYRNCFRSNLSNFGGVLVPHFLFALSLPLFSSFSLSIRRSDFTTSIRWVNAQR